MNEVGKAWLISCPTCTYPSNLVALTHHYWFSHLEILISFVNWLTEKQIILPLVSIFNIPLLLLLSRYYFQIAKETWLDSFHYLLPYLQVYFCLYLFFSPHVGKPDNVNSEFLSAFSRLTFYLLGPGLPIHSLCLSCWIPWAV